MLERLATKYAQVCKRPGFCATLEYRMEISVTAKKLGSRSSCQRNIIKFTWNSRRRRMIQPESRADKRTCRVNLQCGCRLPVWQANCGDGRVAYASSTWYLLRCRDACRLLSLSLRLLYCPALLSVCAVFYGGHGLAELRSTNYRWRNPTLLRMIGAGTQFRRVPPYFDHFSLTIYYYEEIVLKSYCHNTQTNT